MISKEVEDNIKALYPDVTPYSRVVFIGFDPRETMAYCIAKFSIEKRNPNIKVYPLYAKALRQAGLYTRETKVEGTTGQFIDSLDGRPHSVEFSFTRFLVPTIAKILGLKTWCLFIDCDFLCLDNLNTIWDQLDVICKDKSVACVKHDFTPTMSIKMDGVKQLAYNKKLWSAMMFFNPNNCNLTAKQVNTLSGKDLHSFSWLGKTEDKINQSIISLPEGYQFVPGHSDPRVSKDNVVFVHFTEKAPWFHNTFIDDSYWAELWWREVEEFKKAIYKRPKYNRFWE